VAYGTSKAALTFFLESADIELRPRGVAVTAVHPGFVHTAMTAGQTKLPLLMDVDRAVDIIDRGIQRRARMIPFPLLMGGAARVVDALPRAVSAPLVRRAARNAARPARNKDGKHGQA